MPKDKLPLPRLGVRSGVALHNGNLTNEHKVAICEHKKLFPKATHEELRKWAKDNLFLARMPSQSTISSILKDPSKYSGLTDRVLNQRRIVSVEFPHLDEAIANW
ncbi:hypothetical protein BGX20_006785, partial [Mortierella sp. AD010]